jgi:hypothetical protein
VWKRLKLGDSATDPCGIQFYVPTNVDVVAQARNGPIGAGVGADAVVTFTHRTRANACNGIVLAAGSSTTGHGSLLLQRPAVIGECFSHRESPKLRNERRRDTGGEKARAARSALLCSSSPCLNRGSWSPLCLGSSRCQFRGQYRYSSRSPTPSRQAGFPT